MPAHDVVARIKHFNAGRRPDTLAIKYAKLRQNPFSFFRGTCHLFYEDWSPPTWVDAAPVAVIGGDLHLENFGVYLGDNGLACADVNDFDEAALAPVAWDLTRFAASLFVALAEKPWSSGVTRRLVRHFLKSYLAAVAAGEAAPADAAIVPGPIGQMLRQFPRYPAPFYHDELRQLTVRGRRLRTERRRGASNNHLLPAGDDERRRIAALIERLSHDHAAVGECRVLDVARLVAGTSSLGLDRYAVLVDGPGTPTTGRLWEVKEVRPSCLGPYLQHPQPRWPSDAARVTTAQRRLQAVPPGLLWAAVDGGQSFIVRKLSRDHERLNLDEPGWTEDRLQLAVGAIAGAVANGHMRGCQDGDALLAFAYEAVRREGLVNYAQDCARQNAANQRDYKAGYKRGEMAVGA